MPTLDGNSVRDARGLSYQQMSGGRVTVQIPSSDTYFAYHQVMDGGSSVSAPWHVTSNAKIIVGSILQGTYPANLVRIRIGFVLKTNRQNGQETWRRNYKNIISSFQLHKKKLHQKGLMKADNRAKTYP